MPEIHTSIDQGETWTEHRAEKIERFFRPVLKGRALIRFCAYDLDPPVQENPDLLVRQKQDDGTYMPSYAPLRAMCETRPLGGKMTTVFDGQKLEQL